MTKHGLSKHPLYRIYLCMINRCYDKNVKRFFDYGGRGITVCDEWRNSFESFFKWAIDNGWEKGLQIDRHPNNDGNYEPSNCRITSSKLNNRNRRITVMFTYNGVEKPLAQWVDEIGAVVCYNTVYGRIIDRGWSLMDACKTPKGVVLKINPPRGVRHPFSKLTMEQVAEIKKSSLSARKLASIYAVSKTNILNVKKGKTYA